MHDLHTLAKATGRPITAIIATGVREHCAALRDAMDAPRPTPPPIGFQTATTTPTAA
jgi:hypothetical protein